MKGKNTLKLNKDTMHEAVQMWVSSEFTFEPKPRVVAVRQFAETTGYAGNPSIPAYYEIDIQVGDGEPSPDAAPSEGKKETT